MRRADRPQRAAAARFTAYSRKITAEADLELIVARGMDLWADALQQALFAHLPDGAGPLERADALNYADHATRVWGMFLQHGLLPHLGALFRAAFTEQRALLPAAPITAAGEPDDDFERAYREELEKLSADDDVFDGPDTAEYEAEALFGEEFNAERKSADHSAYRYEQEHIATVHDRLVIWPDGAWEEMRPEIEEALAEGESINDVRDRIAHVIGTDRETRWIRADIGDIDHQLKRTDLTPNERADLQARRRALWAQHDASTDDWEYNARRVARTEVQGAVEGGHDAAARAAEAETGEEMWKRWLATPDDRTRFSHRVADGQMVKLGEKFTVGQAHLDHPADPDGLIAGEIINCRCTCLYFSHEEVQAELQSEDGSIGVVRPGGVRLGPDDETAVQVAIEEEKAAQKEWDAEHGGGVTAAAIWNPEDHDRGNRGRFIKMLRKVGMNDKADEMTHRAGARRDRRTQPHPHGLPKWSERERRKRQRALRIKTNGAEMRQAEIEFAERMAANGHKIEWLNEHKAKHPVTGNSVPESDFIWHSNGSIKMELKSTGVSAGGAPGRISTAVRTSRAHGPEYEKRNFVIDVGPVEIPSDLRKRLVDYNANRLRQPPQTGEPPYVIEKLWAMSSNGNLEQINLAKWTPRAPRG